MIGSGRRRGVEIKHMHDIGSNAANATRRGFLSRTAGGLGTAALAALLESRGSLAARSGEIADPLAPRPSHFAAKAHRVLFLFMSGGPSHIDLFDPKPELIRLAGSPIPESFGTFKTRRAVAKNKLKPALMPFRRRGESGIEISDFLPHIAEHADEICLLRGCHGDSVTHPESVYLMNTGSILMGKPSLGAWTTYGLGSENQNMPAYVVMPDPKGWVKGGSPAWGAGFLPSSYQGTILRGGDQPILNLRAARDTSERRRIAIRDLINRLNRADLPEGAENTDLGARIAAYELAFRMQAHAPEVVDVSTESPATRRLYGLDDETTAEFGLRCLFARRMLERGVRFIELYCGDTNGWDAHADLAGNHGKLCAQSDKPIAGLLKDLKARGLLDTTLVVWGGEFGRTPMSEGGDGRDHNPHGFSMWLAGGGVKGGVAIGATDEVGLRAVTDRTHVHDIHATILHLLGFDHTRLVYRHNGRDERLTDVFGEVITKALA